MFYAGCALMYYVVLPYVINFMLTQYAPPDIEKTLRSSDYLERILQLVFAFGFAFEVPVLLTLLIQVGIATTEGLKSKRRYAVVVAFVIAAVLAPPDVVSQIALAIPLMAFYEISILIGGVIERKRAARGEGGRRGRAEGRGSRKGRPGDRQLAMHDIRFIRETPRRSTPA